MQPPYIRFRVQGSRFKVQGSRFNHSRENGNPENPKKHWIPAFARMTIKIFKKLPELIEKLLISH
jgi:hypothetical protein